MFQIAICDDVPTICKTVREILSTHPRSGEMHITEFLCGEDLCDSLQKGIGYDLLILDIELPYINGVLLGRFLRFEMQNHDTQIIYISGHTKYAPALFENQPLSFLTKPINPDKLLRCVNDALRRNELHQPTFQFVNKNGAYRLALRNIRYFEITGKVVTVHSTKADYPCHILLSNIAQALPKDRFVRIHHSFLVHIIFIRYMHYAFIVLDDGTELPISQSYRKTVRRELMSWFTHIERG